MKLVTFSYDGTTRLGALVYRVDREVVIDLHKADSQIPNDMIAFLEMGEGALKLAHKAIPTADGIELSEVRLKAPIARPGKIMCIGLNYSDHAQETGAAIPEYPMVFAKYANTVVGMGDPIVLPKVTQRVDYEAELAFVIGKRARGVPVTKALNYVAGYMPANDVSARDYQRRTSQFTMGKTFDTFAPMGPALVTADEVPNPNSLDIQLTINGEVMQNSNTHNMIFGVAKLVEALSEVMTLDPGDVVLTGTPPGVGDARKPPRYLKEGDVVEITIEKLGTLSNPVVAES